MAEEKILTLHPQKGKIGRNISKKKYEIIKSAFISALKGRQLTHNELFEAIGKKVSGKFSGNISWYAETVKLDLEARKSIERIDSKPQKYRLK